MHGIDLVELITTIGYVGLFLIVFAESGLFFGFFLPGDSLLLTTGLLAYKGQLNIFILLPLLFTAAVLGDNVGYWFGQKTGPRIFNRENSLLFRRKNLLKAKEFYDVHGGKTIVLARFLPFIRTFAPIVAGAVSMNYRHFLFYNLLGGLVWAVGVTLAGYFLGSIIPEEQLERYFLAIVLAVIVISALPALIHVWQDYRHEIFSKLRTRLGKQPQ